MLVLKGYTCLRLVKLAIICLKSNKKPGLGGKKGLDVMYVQNPFCYKKYLTTQTLMPEIPPKAIDHFVTFILFGSILYLFCYIEA